MQFVAEAVKVSSDPTVPELGPETLIDAGSADVTVSSASWTKVCSSAPRVTRKQGR